MPGVWRGNRRGRTPPDNWFTSLRDAPRHGSIRPEIRKDLDVLTARFAATV
ncbi:MAG: hypothetical protein NWQ32_02875 [Paracoccaceae bacterium]|nr:hypothetical protein [Paracoccaceae bacterium]